MHHLTYRSSDDWALHATILADSAAQPLIVLLHAGGPDYLSMLPLGSALSDLGRIALPDIRGYGRSVCRDPERHTWRQYAEDVIALIDHVDVQGAILVGVGIGTTIALRAAAAHPSRVLATVLISVEDIEDDEAKAREIKYMAAFADCVRTQGLEAAWAPILSHFPPLVETLVRDAIPRSDQQSIAAAAAIGYDRSFRSVEELATITTPTLVVPGIDVRHPRALAEKVAAVMPGGQLAAVSMSVGLRTAEDFAHAFAPAIRVFLVERQYGFEPLTSSEL